MSFYMPFSVALGCFFGLFLLISLGMMAFSISLHILLVVSILWVGGLMYIRGARFESIKSAMLDGVHQATGAFYIFLLIGVLIAAFIESGTLSSLVYFGVDWLSPAIFLPSSLILCSLLSIATGSAWGTAGTLGVVLISIGELSGFPLPLIAGAVISGACFGDKMSPVSDTTNLAALSCQTSLYRHIATMLYSTVPAYLLVLLIFSVWGFNMDVGAGSANEVMELKQHLSMQHDISAWALIPFFGMVVLMLLRAPAEIAMIGGIVIAVIFAVLFQERHLVDISNSLFEGYQAESEHAIVGSLLNRGGLMSMMWTFSMAFLALSLGGLIQASGLIEALINPVMKKVRRASTLMGQTIATGVFCNMTMGEAYLSIVLGGRLYAEHFRQRNLDPSMQSRALEEGATLSSPLIPWTTAGAFFAGVLGVQTLEYLPFVLFNLLNPLCSIGLVALGIGVLKRNL